MCLLLNNTFLLFSVYKMCYSFLGFLPIRLAKSVASLNITTPRVSPSGRGHGDMGGMGGMGEPPPHPVIFLNPPPPPINTDAPT